MSDTRTNQALIVPLFGVLIQAPLSFEITPSKFVGRLTAHMFPKPIPVSTGEKPPDNNNPVPIPIPVPRTTVKLFPWGPNSRAEKDNSVFAYAAVLPNEFDLFDNLGTFAVRAGPGGLGGFQTITTLSSKKCASALLLIEFDQVYPKAATPLLSGTNPYESNLVEAMLDAMRLLSGQEPHPYKGYHIAEGKLLDTIIKWPLVEMQGSPINVELLTRSDIERAFFQTWQVRTGARYYPSFKIVTLAMEYYYLSSTMTETRTIFLYLMIAFEALFKKKDEESASAASARLAKLLASSKAQYNEIRRFMWNTKEAPGCCQARNEIVHGNATPLKSETYWKLRSIIRGAIERVLHLVLSGDIDKASYYESVCRIVDKRFRSLPNS